jgi:hypothetical protein
MALKYLKIIVYHSRINLSVVFGWKFSQSLKMKMCPKSFRPKWRCIESIPDVRDALRNGGPEEAADVQEVDADEKRRNPN